MRQSKYARLRFIYSNSENSCYLSKSLSCMKQSKYASLHFIYSNSENSCYLEFISFNRRTMKPINFCYFNFTLFI